MNRLLGSVDISASQKVLVWMYSFFTAYFSVFTDSIKGSLIAIALVLFFMAGDFISGIWASKKYRKISIQSSKLRWSAAKYAVYCFFIIGTIIIGSFLHLMICIFDGIDIKEKTNVLYWTLNFIKAQMLFITWIEAVSIIENFRLVYPENLFLKGLHYVLLFDVAKLIPKFSNFLKENKSKELDVFNKNKKNDNEKTN